MSALGRIRAANRPGPPEHSVLLRVSATLAVAIGVAACAAEGELSAPAAAGAIAALAVGNAFSYRRRTRPLPWLKLVLALGAVIAFCWFFFTVSSDKGVPSLGAVEGPLAVLFTWIQVIHAFDLPSRRDLAFSLVGSATLMAVAAAQALDMTFAPYVVAWALCLLVGLGATWGSMSGAGRPRARTLLAGGVALVGVGLICVLVLPPPSVSSRLVFPSALAGDIADPTSAGLEGSAAGATLPVHAGSPSGRVAVGGFLGFAGPLDTAVRTALSDQLIFRVRATRPTFWIAETFDEWNGQSWSEVTPKQPQWHEITGILPFVLTPEAGVAPSGGEDIQTFYLVQPGPNLVFHADDATQVWFPAPHLYVDRDGNVRSGTSMGTGSVYTVVSSVTTPSPAQLAAAAGRPLDPVDRARFTELPHPYPRVAALARRITAHATSTEAKVLALEAWMGRHTRYTTDIPPLPKGADTVNEFLFGNRRGFCEQISTALAVMLRTLGIPAREATGYVPGPYNPITDLYSVDASDAHAWVQVWFPGYGWQSFDPTALVPDATPSPAATIAHEALGALRRLPAVPTALGAAAVLLAVVILRRRSRRPATPAAALSAQLLRAADRAGLAPTDDESLARVAARLDARAPGPGRASAIAAAAEASAFGGRDLPPSAWRELEAEARAVSRRARRSGGRTRVGAPSRSG